MADQPLGQRAGAPRSRAPRCSARVCQRWAHDRPDGVIVIRRGVVGERVVVAGRVADQLEADLEVLAERRRHDVAPLDDDDPAELGELAEGEVGDLVELLEAVHVGMVELPPRRGVRSARA